MSYFQILCLDPQLEIKASSRSAIDKESVNANSAFIDVNSKAGRDKLVEILSEIQSKDNRKCECKLPDISEQASSQTKSDKKSDKTDKKLTSGKITKPDESDIKQQVKYAHEKLNAKHVKERVFDKLEFAMLIAGELELISRPEISENERSARTEIAKILCYHKLYLNDDDLRNGYDAILKTVEQGTAQWGPELAQSLNSYCEFRANIAWRENSKKSNPGNKEQKSRILRVNPNSV